jgi:hypothetical protein
MSAGVYDFEVEQGATFTRVFTWTTGTTGCSATTAPVDLTGYTARMQIRPNVSSTTVIFEANTSNGNIVLGGSAGTITLTIPAADTATFNFSRAVYDLELTTGVTVTRLLQGTVTLSREVTR